MSDFKVFYHLIKNDIFKQNENSSQPRFLGKILDKNGKSTSMNLRYFHLPHSVYPLNLNNDSKDIGARTEISNLVHIEKYCIQSSGLNNFQNTTKHKVVTTRNVILKIMNFPYRMKVSNFQSISIHATKFGDTIYLIRNRSNYNEPTNFQTYLLKFQQYCYSVSPYVKPKTDEPIFENNGTYGLFQYSVGDFDILYTAYIDGVESNEEINDFKNMNALKQWKFVQTKLVPDTSDYPNFNWRKSPHILRTWLQCYLGNVENICFGFRTRDGFIKEQIQYVNVQDLPTNQFWKPEVCNGFLRDFLISVQKKMSSIDCPYTVFEFDFDPKFIKYRVFEGKTEKSFLSEEFIQYMQRK